MRFLTVVLKVTAPSVALYLCASPIFCQSGAQPSKDTPAAVQQIQNGVQLTAGDLNEKVQLYAGGIVRVVKWPIGGTSAKVSLSVIQKDLPVLSVSVKEDADKVTLTSEKLTLLVSKSDGSIEFLDSKGNTVLKERGKASFEPTGIEKEHSAFSVQQAFTLSADQGVYGLGQQQAGVMN